LCGPSAYLCGLCVEIAVNAEIRRGPQRLIRVTIHDHSLLCGVEINRDLRVSQFRVEVEMERQRCDDFPFDDSLQWTRAQARVKSSLGHVVYDAIRPNESEASLQHSFARIEGV